MLYRSQMFKLAASILIAGAVMLSLGLTLHTTSQVAAASRVVATTDRTSHAPLATLVVNSLTDTSGPCATTGTGTCTLRDALTYANNHAGAHTITFSTSGTIILASTLVISDDLTIDGSGQAITVSGNNLYRVLTVYTGTQVSLMALTIANGFCNNCSGSGISSSGRLTVTDSTFSSNVGGAIWSSSWGISSRLTVINSTFISNSSAVLGGGGAGISNYGLAAVRNSTFSGNGTESVSDGGVIYNAGTAAVTDSTFVHNFTSSYVGAGAGIVNAGTLTVTNSTFSDNINSGGSGGAIINYDSGMLNIANSTFNGNLTNFSGGGIYNAGTLNITNSTFKSNSAIDGGGGGGGGIENGGTLTVTNSIFSGNSTSYGFGGGIGNYGPAAVTNSTFRSNSAIDGGGITNAGTLTITNSTLSGNSAWSGSGGISNTGMLLLRNTIVAGSTSGSDCAGTIAADHYNLADDSTCGSATVTNTAALKLGPLQNNGGSTWTIALGVGSAAIDRGDDNVCPATDQRGWLRPQGAHCDVGAYEYSGHSVFLPLVLK